MEDALVPVHRHYVCVHGFVLILVLMEDALVLLMFFKNMQRVARLNPCFNGRCTRTISQLQVTSARTQS